MSSLTKALTFAAIFAMGLTGCGDSEVAQSSAKSAFVKRANSICAKSNERAGEAILSAYERKDVKLASGEARSIDLEATVFMPILLRTAHSQHEGIQALRPPSRDEESVRELLAAYSTWLAEARRAPRRVIAAGDFYTEARRLAANYGLRECATNPFYA